MLLHTLALAQGVAAWQGRPGARLQLAVQHGKTSGFWGLHALPARTVQLKQHGSVSQLDPQSLTTGQFKKRMRLDACTCNTKSTYNPTRARRPPLFRYRTAQPDH